MNTKCPIYSRLLAPKPDDPKPVFGFECLKNSLPYFGYPALAELDKRDWYASLCVVIKGGVRYNTNTLEMRLPRNYVLFLAHLNYPPFTTKALVEQYPVKASLITH